MKRTVKSYVLRAGRTSNRQQQGLEQWLVDYELALEESPWELPIVFGREAKTVIEIGFGMGASLITTAKQHPELNFIGIEVHKAGIGSLAADLHDFELTNVRIVPHDAVAVIKNQIANESLDGIQLFFPDPWPKKRHHKRRIVQAEFVKLLAEKLKPGGFCHCATDWQDYAQHMHAILSAESLLINQQPAGGFSPRPSTRPVTKFEQRGNNLGHGVWDLIYIKR